MALQGTKAQFAELYSDLSDYKGADLYAQADALIKWQALSEIAELQTEEHDTANSVYNDVLIYHSNNMWLFAANRDIPTLSERAFTLALTSIELARTDAQGKAVAHLLNEVTEILYGKNDVTDDVERHFLQEAIYHQQPYHAGVHDSYNEALATAKAKLQTRLNALDESGESDFYIDMISKLGPRLDPANQAAVLAWVVRNGMIDHSDLNNPVQFAAGIENPDSYSRHYNREAMAEAGEKLMEVFSRRNGRADYSDEYRGWTTALLLKDNPRFLGDIELPNVEDEGTTPYAVWVNPIGERRSRVFLVDEEKYDNSRMIHGLVSSFSDAAKAASTDEQYARFKKGQRDLAQLVVKKLRSQHWPHEIEFALNEGGAFTLSHLENG